MIVFKHSYKALKKQSFVNGSYAIIPIRFEDRYDIMQWRNEQIYHLRQAEPLTKEDQDRYFKNVVSQLFDQEQPNQMLFSYLKNGECIGYGGLVHINWIDKHAEVSFVMKTELEKDEFKAHWGIFLGLIEKVGFQELKLHKLFTYAFDLRPHLYEAIELKGYSKEAVLIEHCYFNQEYLDVVIHSKINHKIEIIEANLSHAKMLFEWANEKEVRANSLNTEPIKWEDHLKWFASKINNRDCRIFIFKFNGNPIGQVRLDFENNVWLIDYSIDRDYRGKGFGTRIINKVLNIDSFKHFKAVVKSENKASLTVFKKLGFNQNSRKGMALLFI